LQELPPQEICFEITETSAIANLTQAVALIEKMKALGCRIALDDFGTSMSSFAYFKHLPVDYLKIDGEFVKDLISDSVDQVNLEYTSTGQLPLTLFSSFDVRLGLILMLIDNLQSDDPRSVLMFTMLSAFAQLERSPIEERQREGMALAKAKGTA
jgi:EAL domain/Resolvase, N terminal domain